MKLSDAFEVKKRKVILLQTVRRGMEQKQSGKRSSGRARSQIDAVMISRSAVHKS